MSTHRSQNPARQVKHHQAKRIFRVLGVIILLLIIIGAVGAGIHWKKQVTAAQLRQSRLRYEHKKTTTSAKQTDWHRSAMDQLKIGDLTKKGHGGAQLTALIAKYGQPAKTKKGSEKGLAIQTVTWKNIAGESTKATFTLSTVNGHVYRKALNHYQLAKRKNHISVANYDNLALQTTSYKKTTADFGQPDTFEESLINGTHLVVGYYTSNIAGNNTASIRLAFSNNLLIGKSQTGIE